MYTEFRDRTWTGVGISPKQTEFATRLRVPFLTTYDPRWRYITGIVVGDTPFNDGLVPTEEEVTLVADYLNEYCDHWYGDNGFRGAMREFAPYDIDSGANSAYFIKYHSSFWGYRRYTWSGSSIWRPGPHGSTLTIQEAIEHLRTH